MSNVDEQEGEKFTIVQNATHKKAWGCATLLLVALLYGTLGITVRAIYDTDGPPATCVLVLVNQLLNIVAFVPILLVSKLSRNNERTTRDESRYCDEGFETEALIDGEDGLKTEALLKCKDELEKG